MKISWKKIAAFTLSEIMVVLFVISVIALATYKISASRTDYVYKYMHAAALRNLKRGVGEIIADGTTSAGVTTKTLPTDGPTFCAKFAELANTVGTINCSQIIDAVNPVFDLTTANFIGSNGIRFFNFGSNPVGTAPNQVYKVYVDIDGAKGSSTLNKDVWPFCISMKGRITDCVTPESCGSVSGTQYEQSGSAINMVDIDTNAICSSYTCGHKPPSDIRYDLVSPNINVVDTLSNFYCASYPCGSNTSPGTGSNYSLSSNLVIQADKTSGKVCTTYNCGSGTGGNSISYSLSGSTITKTITDLTSSPNLICSDLTTTYTCGTSGKTYSMSGSTVTFTDNASGIPCINQTYTCGDGGTTASLQGTTVKITDNISGYLVCNSYTCGQYGTTPKVIDATTTQYIDNLSGVVCSSTTTTTTTVKLTYKDADVYTYLRSMSGSAAKSDYHFDDINDGGLDFPFSYNISQFTFLNLSGENVNTAKSTFNILAQDVGSDIGQAIEYLTGMDTTNLANAQSYAISQTYNHYANFFLTKTGNRSGARNQVAGTNGIATGKDDDTYSIDVNQVIGTILTYFDAYCQANYQGENSSYVGGTYTSRSGGGCVGVKTVTIVN